MNESKLLEELGKYLESKGWKPLVIGFKGIAQGEGKYNYSLIVDFTGKKIEDATPSFHEPQAIESLNQSKTESMPKGCRREFQSPLPKEKWDKCGDILNGDLILCNDCRKKSLHTPEKKGITIMSVKEVTPERIEKEAFKEDVCANCGHSEFWHEHNTHRCKKFLKKSKSETEGEKKYYEESHELAYPTETSKSTNEKCKEEFDKDYAKES